MNRKIIVIFSLILFNFIIIPIAQTRLEGEVKRDKGIRLSAQEDMPNMTRTYEGGTRESQKDHRVLRFCLAGIIMLAALIYALAKGENKLVVVILLLFSALVAGILTILELKDLLKEVIRGIPLV